MEDKETVTLMPGQTIIGTKYTKSNYVERLEKENAELKAENETLKSQLDFEVQKKEVFGIENERLKEEFRIESLTDKTTGETIYRSNLVNKYRIILQEIMVIAEELLEKGLEPQSVEHQLRLRGKRELANIILQVITKAESEEEDDRRML